jgi:ATP-binding cassette subfamily A (ABC1) protein 3
VFPNGVKALDKINFDIYENQIFCLLGHNGAGKTTLINILTGMLHYTRGRVFVNNKDLKRNIDSIR